MQAAGFPPAGCVTGAREKGASMKGFMAAAVLAAAFLALSGCCGLHHIW
ncbi:hypothetical protein GEOBRER4_n2096 [Citrifermentans bremense]|uniref:Uncharacterized protein n=1 Tax=Citrifermentans bremense TaxID=60035 RepID=A0A7R7FS90_9BACT|nr:hypothetical protein GEOBRER4_n2096 [Citrifermentans bremense]